MAFDKPNYGMLGTSGTFEDFTPSFGLSSQMEYGGEYLTFERSFSVSDTGIRPSYAGSFEIDCDQTLAEGNRMLNGGIFIQGRLDGGTGTEEAYFSSIAGFAVQNMNGDGDGIGVHGRARKTGLAGNIGDAAGTLGDAYQYSTETGGVMGLEGRIYNNVAGRTAGDGYNNDYWETAINLISDSTGSPALAAMLVTGTGWNVGKYSFWNGINISRETFAHNGVGAGISGTVGINMGDWDATYHAETAIKFGTATWHLKRGDFPIYAQTNRIEVIGDGGTSGFRAVSKGTTNAYLDFYDDATAKMNFFWDSTNDDVRLNSAGVDLSLRRDGVEHIRLENGETLINQLPTSAPTTAGFLWNDSGTVKVST